MFRKNILVQLIQLNISRSKLARKMDITTSALSQKMTGKSSFKEHEIRFIIRFLKFSDDQIVESMRDAL